MSAPPLVRRAAWRVVMSGLAAASLVALGGLAIEWFRFGTSDDVARTRLSQELQMALARAEARLDRLANSARDEAVLASAVTGDNTAARDLFARLAVTRATLGAADDAVSLFDPQGRLVAWSGRPEPLPPERVNGPDALFLAPGATGLRLTRVVGVTETPSLRRLATIVAETPLPATDVVIDLPFASSAGGDEAAVMLNARDGSPIGRAQVTASRVRAARQQWRAQLLGAEGLIVTAVLLLLTGPLLDWRRLTMTLSQHARLTGAIVVLLLAARLVAWQAVRWMDIAHPPLVSADRAGWLTPLLASPVDFLFSALVFAGVVALSASSYEQWRHARWRTTQVVPDAGSLELVAFLAVQAIAGVTAGLLILGYQWFVHSHVTAIPLDVLHLSLHPADPPRLAVASGLVVVHAALLTLLVVGFRLATMRWVVSGPHTWLRVAAPALWLVPAWLVLAVGMRTWDEPPRVAGAAVVTVAVLAAWQFRRARARLGHASQAARLAALFVMFVVPSVVFYPSLVSAAERARRQIVETRYAPEVMSQRRNLQLQLEQVMGDVDALPDLSDLVQAAEPANEGPVAYEAAFRVWEQTLLEARRLTSSVELHDAQGQLVSRFALKLPPQTGDPQSYLEPTCEWQVFEEVSPFFSEERRLLHAGRSICVDGPLGSRIAGAIAIHVTLDYSNSSFIAAQSPYAALLRAGQPAAERASLRDAVEFTVYGWSRRPIYMSARDTWALTEDTFARVLASREPFWTRAPLAAVPYDVYLLNDRVGIYALGFATTTAVDHVTSLAELIVLGALVFLALLLAGLVYGRITARTPMSGRALLREVRASFYRKLFLAFVAAAVLPVLALALVTRAYIAQLMQGDLEREAARTAASASRVIEDVGRLVVSGTAVPGDVGDDIVVWLSRLIAQDVNIFDESGLVATSERALFAYGLLPRSTESELYRAIVLDGRPSYVARESVGATEYLVAAAPVRLGDRPAILAVPLTLRQQEIDRQVVDLDRRILLATVLFILVGAGLGYSLAERIADPVNRLMRATGRIARGELDVRVLATSSDELKRLVDEFNRMAADLQRQRAELERSNRLAAWADMARQVAHDIKNPLTPVQLNAEHLLRVHQDRGAPLGQVLDDCVANILTQVRLLRQIASEFASFASSPTVKPAVESLHVVVEDVIHPYRMVLRGRIAIELDVPDTLPQVMVDKAVLARALTNIIENALHAMPGNGTLRFGARVSEPGWIALAIADTGVGMDSAALARIFEPYFSTRASGTGLGLTIAKRNIELHGGTLTVTSERGRGTTVQMTLPTPPAA